MPDAETHGCVEEALLAVQAEAPTLQKDAINPHFKNKYVSLDTLMDAVLPILNKHGLVWVTMPSQDAEGRPVLRYRLIHAAGKSQAERNSIEGSMALMLTKQDPQGQGSAITYARRYSLMAVLGLVANEDDDAKAATRANKRAQKESATPRRLTDDERLKVVKAIEAAGHDEDGLVMVLGAVGAESTDDLTTAQAFEIRKLLDKGKA
jgi:hypothetical protein